MILQALTILFLAQGTAAPQAPARASVAGVVVNSETGEPVANMRVTLARTDAPPPAVPLQELGHHDTETTIPVKVLETVVETATIMKRYAEASGQKAASAEPVPNAAAVRPLPLDQIHAIIAGPAGRIDIIPKSSPPIETGNDGRFAFHDLEPGVYRLTFAANGYARRDWGQRATEGPGTPIELKSGQSVDNIVMRVTPTGAIAGRITDTAGRPIAAVPVDLMRVAYDASGRKKPVAVASSRTDDRGAYRFYFLSPGAYYLNAGGATVTNDPSDSFLLEFAGPGGPSASENRIAESYAGMYYPGAADVRAAAAIHVTPGADLDGIDLRLNALRYYRVRGRIVDPRTGNPPRQVRLRLSTANGGSIRRGQRYDVESGSFEMWNLSPGVFSVIAELAPPPGEESPPFRASTTVVIADADVEGVALVLAAVAAGTSIGGRVSLDAGAAAQPAFPLELLRVQLSAASTDEMNWDAPQLDAQGAIRLKNIQPGEYWLMLDGIPTGFYIKEARFGGVDALNRPVVAPSVLEAHHTLDIVIGSKVGKVEGTVLDSNGRPAPLAQVVLIPNRNRHRSELFRPVTADAAGHFSITNITPGDYRLAAWETLEPYEFFDPARMAQAEALGKPVQVTESSSENLTLRLIPAAAP